MEKEGKRRFNQTFKPANLNKIDLTLKILKAEKENQVFSPINIAHAFGLLLYGAGGDTEKQLCNIFGYGEFKRLKSKAKQRPSNGWERYPRLSWVILSVIGPFSKHQREKLPVTYPF